MISVNYHQIPLYLRNSDFYVNLSPSEEEQIEIPSSCFKEIVEVASVADMTSMLETMRFWGLTEPPDPLLEFMLYTEDLDIDHLTEQFPELRFVPVIQEMHRCPDSSMLVAIEANSLDIIRFLESHGHAIETKHLNAAAKKGVAAVITYLLDQNYSFPDNACTLAAREGNLAVLQCFHERGYALSEEAAFSAAYNGRLDCLRYLHEHGCPWTEAVYTQALKDNHDHNHVDCFLYAAQHGCPMNALVTSACAAAGNLACLTIVRERGCVWDEATCAAAARCGSLVCLQYAHEHGCSWDVQTCRSAAEGGHLPCLQYAHEHGCPWEFSVCAAAAWGGSVDCLAYAHEQGCPWGLETCVKAAEASSLTCLRYALENGCPTSYPNRYTVNIIDIIVGNGQPALLKCAMDHGFHGDRHSVQLASELINKSPAHTEVYMMLLRDNCAHNTKSQFGTSKDEIKDPPVTEGEIFEGVAGLFD